MGDNYMRDAHNRLTAYAFACGYLEKTETINFRVQIYMPSPSAGFYEVFYWDLEKGSKGRQWHTFRNRTEAYRLYRKLRKQILQ